MNKASKAIKKEIKHPGKLTAGAKKAGMTIHAFAVKHKHDAADSEYGDAARYYLNVLHPLALRNRKS